MRAGRLRHRVTLQSKSVTRNTYNEEAITWVNEATVWGSVEPLRGTEFTDMKRAGADVSTRIVIRHRSGVVPEWRAIEGGKTYDILSVINTEHRDREIHLMCREVLEP